MDSPHSAPNAPAPSSDLSGLAAVLAGLGTLIHATDAPLWRADSAILAIDSDTWPLVGGVSTSLSRAFSGLPLGSHLLRTSLLGAVMAACSAWLLTRAAHRLFEDQAARSRLDRWLALAAALSVVLSLPFLTESTLAGGGAALGTSLSIALLTWLMSGERRRPNTLLAVALLGLLLGTIAVESPWTAGALSLAVLTAWPLPDKRRLAIVTPAVALGSYLLLELPALLAVGPHELTSLEILPTSATWPAWQPLGYASKIGLLYSAGAIVAFFVGPRDRRPLLACAVLLACDWFIPATPTGSWIATTDSGHARSVLHLAALATLAPLGAVGLRGIAAAARNFDLLGARQTAALVTLLALAGSVAGIEDAHRVLVRTELSGTRTWTSAALDHLPHGAIVLTHSNPVSQRLLAAQTQGERPDLLVVPVANLARASQLTGWLAKEPTLELLIRDLSLDDAPSERALTALADHRPLYIEPDASWDPRLLEHVEPGVPLARFSVAALGRSDRRKALDSAARAMQRVDVSTSRGLYEDTATRAILKDNLERNTTFLEAIGDRGTLQILDESAPTKLSQQADKALAKRDTTGS